MNPTSNRLEDRNKSYQRSIDESEIKKLRDEKQVSLRKKKRIENYVKRSRLVSELAENTPEEFFQVPEILSNLSPVLSDRTSSPYDKIVTLASIVNQTKDSQVLSAGLEQMRKYVSTENLKCLEVLSKTELVLKFSEYLRSSDLKVKLNTAWIITNLTSVESPSVLPRLASGGVIEALGRLATEDQVNEANNQAVWALSNIAGESKDYRNLVFNTGIFSSVIRKISMTQSLELNTFALYIWLLSNLLKFSPMPEESMVKAFLGVLPKFLLMSQEDILTDTLRCLFYLTAQGTHLAEVFATLMVSRIISLSLHDSPKIKAKAVQVLSNLSLGDEVYTRFLLDNKLLDALSVLIDSDQPGVVNDALLVISNVAMEKNTANVILNLPLFKNVINRIASHDRNVRMEALIAAKHLVKFAGNAGFPYQRELLENLIAIIQISDPDSILMALEVADVVFTLASTFSCPAALALFYELGGIESLERLNSHPNLKIYESAAGIYKNFFEESLAGMNSV